MQETTDAATIFAPIWRRKWLVLAIGILVAAGAYAYYKNKKPSYAVTTQIYLGGGSEETGGSLTSGSSKKNQLNAANQTALINSTLILEPVRKRLRAESATNPIAQSAYKGKVKAKSKEKSLFIAITGEARTARGAALLANRVAQAYVTRENAQFRKAVTRALTVTRGQVRHIESSEAAAAGKKGSKGGTSTNAAGVIQIAQLHSRENQLEAELSNNVVQQVATAKPRAAQVQVSSPRKNAIFAFVIGLVLASIAAYVLARFDRRLRTLSEIEGAFGAPILAALPAVRRPVVHEEGTPRPSAMLLEPLRRLHATLQVGEPPHGAGIAAGRQLLFLSADAGDGKSSVIADLALVQRDAGKRVLVLEADFRRPVQSKLLGVSPPHGLAEVLAGHVGAEGALAPVGGQRHGTQAVAGGAGSGVATVVETGTGALSLLTSGAPIANPPALLASQAMTSTLRTLTEEFDYVLIDAPSPLEVSDVIPLLPVVNGIVIVARAGHTREASARRLAELLQRTTTTPVLGVVANYVRSREIARYGFSSAHGSGRRLARS